MEQTWSGTVCLGSKIDLQLLQCTCSRTKFCPVHLLNCCPSQLLTLRCYCCCCCNALQYMVQPTELVPTGLPVVPEPARSELQHRCGSAPACQHPLQRILQASS